MSRVRDIANILSTNTSMATDAEVTAASAYIPANLSGKNFIINGGMDIAQRGTSLSGVNGYWLDRWLVNGYGTSSNISVGQYLISTLIPGLRYYMRVAPTTSNTQNFWISQSLETSEVIRLAGKTVTLSFYYRMPFAFTGTWSAAAAYSTGTDANLHYPASATSIFAENLSGTAAWQRYTKTFTVPLSATSFAIQLQSTNNVLSTAMFDITGVQLEIGSVATDFSRAGGDIGGELRLCQRYYWKFGGENVYQFFGNGLAPSTGGVYYFINNPTPMRVGPTAIEFSGLAAYDGPNALTVNNLILDRATRNGAFLFATVSNTTQYRPYMLTTNNNANGYLAFSAEI